MKIQPPLDPDAIAALRSIHPDDGGAFLRELVEIFLTDTPRRIDELAAALAAGDAPTATRAAHSMKGSAGNFGATPFAALNRRIELRARDGHLDGLAELLPEVREEYERVRAALESQLAPDKR